MHSRLMTNLIKLHLRTIKGKYIRQQNVYLPNGKTQEVTVFGGSNCLFLGQCSPLGTIVVHEALFSNKPLLDYVVVHETAHRKQWWKFVIWLLALLAVLETPYFLSLSLTSIYQTITTHSRDYLLDFPIGLITAVALMALPCFFSWMLELDADIKTIGTIGLKSFLKLQENELNRSRLKMDFVGLINVLLHPPTGLTVNVWNWRQKRENII